MACPKCIRARVGENVSPLPNTPAESTKNARVRHVGFTHSLCILPLSGSPTGEGRGAHVAKDRIDRDEEDLVRLYLTDIGQYALLTKDDEEIGRAHV